MVLAILSTAFYGATVVRSLLYERITAGLEDTASMLKNTLVETAPADLDRFSKTVGTPYTRVTIIDDDGIVLGDSESEPAMMDNHGTRPEIKLAYLDSVGSSIRYSDTLKRNMVYLALPAFSFLDKIIVLRTATPLRSLSSDLKGAYTSISIAGVVVLFLVSLLGYLLTDRINGALQIIRHTVSEYSKGNLSYRPHVYRPPELKRVADTISSLAEDLLAQAAESTKQRDALEAVFSGMSEAVIVLDGDLVIQELNTSALGLADLDSGEAAGKDLLLVFRNSRLYDVAREVASKRGKVEGDIVYFSDRERHLQVKGTIISGDNAQERIVLVMNDVTRLKRLEQVRKDFVANVSHELKTPITAVKGYVETLLGGDYRNPEIAADFLGIVLNHVDRLNAIVEDLLIISRLEQGTDVLPEKDRLNAYELISSAVSLYRSRAEGKGQTFSIACNPDLSITANRILMEQALGNLIDNAIKYSHEGGDIEIAACALASSDTLSVRDTGSGIPAEHIDRIFERFYRIDKGRSRDLGGTGLGLSIVKHIALSHGGTVSVESIEDEGSLFTIVLPKGND